MDFRLLEDFLCLTQSRSFSRAAEARRITQPAFSRRIQQIETWVGAPLIDRSTYPTTLTPAGLIFQSAAEDILRRIALARKDVANVHAAGNDTVVVSVLHTLSLTFVPQWLRSVEARIGPVKCRFLSENMHNGVEALVEGACDLLLCFTHPSAALSLDHGRFPCVGLGHDTVLPVTIPDRDGCPAFPLPGRPDAPSRYLAYAPDSYLGRVLEHLIRSRPQRLHLSRVCEHSLTEALKAMVVAGHGCAWLPMRSVADELAGGRLVRAGPPSWDLEVEIRLYRAAERSRAEVERIWAVCADGAAGQTAETMQVRA